MKRDNHIVYSITKNIHTGALVDITFLNSFETTEQAKASLQYEADVCKHENDQECVWLGEDTLKLPQGWNPDEETIIYIDSSVKFHDRAERPFNYLVEREETAKTLQEADIVPKDFHPADVFDNSFYLPLEEKDSLWNRVLRHKDELEVEDPDHINEAVFEVVYKCSDGTVSLNCNYNYSEYGLSLDGTVELPLSEGEKQLVQKVMEEWVQDNSNFKSVQEYVEAPADPDMTAEQPKYAPTLESKEQHGITFIFDDELTLNDDMETVEGYLWATDDLMKHLFINAAEQEREGYIPGAVIENANFYACYNLRTGRIQMESTYWTQEMEGGHVIEVQPCVNILLSKEQESKLISTLESYCRDECGVSCLEFVNNLRRDDHLDPLREDVSERFPSAVFHVTYLNNELYFDDDKVFLGKDDQLYCQLSDEQTRRPLRSKIEDIQPGDAFFLGDYGLIRTASYDAQRKYDEHSHSWIVDGVTSECYFKENIGSEFADKVKAFLLEHSRTTLSQPSFENLLKDAADRAAAGSGAEDRAHTQDMSRA